MIVKKFIAALALALTSVAAAATPLGSVAGDVIIKLGGLTTDTRLTADSNESTWGVGYLETITSFNNDTKWIAGTGDGYLYYMMYGVADLSVIGNSSQGFDIFNVGATGGVADGKIHLDIYYSPTKISSIDQQKNASPELRTGFNSYAAFNGLGPAYLKLTFGVGIQLFDRTETSVDERLATLVQHTVGDKLPTSGNGAFFLDVAGGTAASQWENDGQAGHDMSGNFTLRANSSFGGGCTVAQVSAGVCFAGLINDPILTTKIPEPGSLALLGLGLVGLGALRRRRNAS